jgi:hypothetical protein
MLNAGLNDTVFRSIENNITIEGLSISNTVYLFSGDPPIDISDMMLTLTGNLDVDTSYLVNRADAILDLDFSVTRDSTSIKFNIANGFFGNYFEKFLAYKGKPDLNVYDTGLAAYRNLGDCIVYYANSIASNYSVSSGLPSVTIPTRQSPNVRNDTHIENSAFSGKYLRGRYNISSWYFYMGRRANNKNASGQDLPTNNHRGHGMVIFDSPIEADFIMFSLVHDGTTIYNTNLSSLSLILEDNTFVELPVFGVSPSGIIYLVPFAKRTIKGVRMANAYQPINTSTQTFCNYYCPIFTVGLSEYQTTDLANPTRDIITHALVVPTLNPVRQSQATKSQPLMLLSVGNEESSAELKVQAPDSMYISSSSVVDKTLMELPK